MRTLAKLRTLLALVFFLGLGGSALWAQQDQQFVHFQIHLEDQQGQVQETIHWFVENTWIGNAGGEGIVELGENAYDKMLSRLETIRNDQSVKKFELDKAKNELNLVLVGLSGAEANAFLEGSIKAEPKD